MKIRQCSGTLTLLYHFLADIAHLARPDFPSDATPAVGCQFLPVVEPIGSDFTVLLSACADFANAVPDTHFPFEKDLTVTR